MKIKEIICNTGYPAFWHEQLLFPQKEFMKTILYKRLEDQQIQTLNFESNTNGKCGVYRIFKFNNYFEPYLTKLDYIDRIYLCKYRAGCHNLPVTESRINKNKPEVFCNLCDMKDVGDEYHFLFHCKKFQEQRKKFLKKYYYIRPNTFKMEELFNCTNIKTLRNLARFCKEIILSFKKSKTAVALDLIT